MAGALQGIKVLDLSSYIAGPFATMLLADLGAEVVKIEVPGKGDEFRSWSKEPKGYSPFFCGLNRNKKSLTLNVQSKDGKHIFLQLAERSDVILENFRPGVVGRLGIAYETVYNINPRIIYCSVSGYGQDGPYRDRPGYDTIGQAMGGLLSLLTDVDSPQGPGVAFSDHLAGIYACYGILAALVERERTGKGQRVDTSLLEATIGFLGDTATRYLATGVIPRMHSRVHSAQVYAFVSGDRLPFVIHLSSPHKFWVSLTEAVKRPDLREDIRFKDREERIKNYEVLHKILGEIFARDTRAKWLRILQEKDVPAVPIKNLREVFEDPQVRYLNMVVNLEHPKFGPLHLVKSGVNLTNNPAAAFTLPPMLGQHTQEILLGLGLSADDVHQMRSKGVI